MLLSNINRPSPGVRKGQKSPWFERDPALLEDVQRALREPEYKWLHLHLDQSIARIRGTIPVPEDRYSIEILFLNDYPLTLPQVRETGGRIPHTSDRHVNPKDGTACLCIPVEWFTQRPDESFLTFLRGPLYNYFLSQKTFETLGEWPLGERRHGNDGLLDFYQECLGTNNPHVIKQYLQCFSQDTVKGHWDCPCGSGNRIRNCHHEKIADLRKKLPPHIAFNALKYLSSVS